MQRTGILATAISVFCLAMAVSFDAFAETNQPAQVAPRPAQATESQAAAPQPQKRRFFDVLKQAFTGKPAADDGVEALTATESPRRTARVRKPAAPRVAALPKAKDPIAGRIALGFLPLETEDLTPFVELPAKPEPGGVALALAYTDSSAETRRVAPTPALAAIQDLVAKHAKAHGVPTELAHALVQVESSYNPRATGAQGEIGLMQISPKTAQRLGYTGALQELYDPETNLAWGMKYLARAHKLGGGDVCQTVLRYNAGHDATRMNAASSRFCAKVKTAMAQSA